MLLTHVSEDFSIEAIHDTPNIFERVDSLLFSTPDFLPDSSRAIFTQPFLSILYGYYAI